MTAVAPQLLVEALELLRTITCDRVGTQQALMRVEALGARHPDVGLELVWNVEAFDHSIHYDLLVRTEDATLSLAHCPHDSLPWPMRSVQRWSDANLLRVNGRAVEVMDAMGVIDFVWRDQPLLDRLVDASLIEQAVSRERIEVTDEEIQDALDAFRRANGICSVEETARWMDRYGMTHERLERQAVEQASAVKLRERVTAGRVEEYFERHRSDFDLAHLARLEVQDEETADRILAQVRDGAIGFLEAAQRNFLKRVQGGLEPPDMLFTTVRRTSEPAALAAAVFASLPDGLVGPVGLEGGYVVARVLELVPATLDDETRRRVKQRLFSDWLSEQKRTASVEWNWGDASHGV